MTSYMERRDLKLSLAVIVGAAFILLVSFFPLGYSIPQLQGMTQMEEILLGLLVVVVGGAVMVFAWHLIHVAGQAVAIFALVVFGVFIAFPAFIALGLVGLLFTGMGLHKSMGRRMKR
jgi:hypothetical protein